MLTSYSLIPPVLSFSCITHYHTSRPIIRARYWILTCHHWQQCPGGFFCTGGDAVKEPCRAPPGRFCAEGSSNGEGNSDCPVGTYCNGYFFLPLDCLAVSGNYCPKLSSDADGVTCPAGFFCAGFKADKAACEASSGSFCPQGTKAALGSLCPVGSFCQVTSWH